MALQDFVLENQKLVNYYDEKAEEYNSRWRNYIDSQKKVLQPFIQKLKADFGSRPRVVDLGCSVGLNAHILENQDFDVTGLDYSANLLKHAKNNCPKSKFIHTNFLEWQPEEKFHGVIAGSFLDKFHPDLVPDLLGRLDNLLIHKGYGLMYVSGTPEQEKKANRNQSHSYVSLLQREHWLNHISNNFKIVNYYTGYGDRDWFINIFQKK